MTEQGIVAEAARRAATTGSSLDREIKLLLKRRRRRVAARKARVQALRDRCALVNEEERSEFFAQERERLALQKKAMTNHMEECYSAPVGSCHRVCINCSFDGLMSDKELASLASQLAYTISGVKQNRDVKMQLHLSSFERAGALDGDTAGVERSRLEQHCMHFGLKNWKVHCHTEPFWDVFQDDEIVVLSPDADHDLEYLDPRIVYVVGGLVDRTVNSGQTRTQAASRGLIIRRLPIRAHVDFIASPVLTINTVVDILRGFIRDGCWRQTFQKHLPVRRLRIRGSHSLRKANRSVRLEQYRERELRVVSVLSNALAECNNSSEVVPFRTNTASECCAAASTAARCLSDAWCKGGDAVAGRLYSELRLEAPLFDVRTTVSSTTATATTPPAMPDARSPNVSAVSSDDDMIISPNCAGGRSSPVESSILVPLPEVYRWLQILSASRSFMDSRIERQAKYNPEPSNFEGSFAAAIQWFALESQENL